LGRNRFFLLYPDKEESFKKETLSGQLFEIKSKQKPHAQLLKICSKSKLMKILLR